MPDGLLSRYTGKLQAADVGETTRFVNDRRTRGARRPPSPQRLAALIVRQGKEPDRAFELREDRMTIGRSHEGDVVLDDASVSRVHAIVTRDEAGYYNIRDQDSANGTYVNGLRIFEQALEDGDEIQVGLTVLAFRF